ncbi:MAG: class I SAM-dependent methyltransferase [Pseudomonadota bacterium]
MSDDASNGYDAIADDFIAVRSASGRDVVDAWAHSLPAKSAVIDLGAGHGEPLTSVLIDRGLMVCAIDASPKMVAAFSARFPDVEIACEAVEDSRFFDRRFDGAIAVGLIFLLPEDRQRRAIKNIAEALKPGGRFLFSAPRQVCAWEDLLTGLPSRSLGADAYRRLLDDCDLDLDAEHEDAGGTHYYDAVKQLR